MADEFEQEREEQEETGGEAEDVEQVAPRPVLPALFRPRPRPRVSAEDETEEEAESEEEENTEEALEEQEQRSAMSKLTEITDEDREELFGTKGITDVDEEDDNYSDLVDVDMDDIMGYDESPRRDAGNKRKRFKRTSRHYESPAGGVAGFRS